MRQRRNAMLEKLLQYDPILLAFLANMFTWLMTALGAGMVFFFKSINKKVLNAMLGFAVMMFLDVALG
jgi:zinc transporter, ZIP family